MHAGCIDGQVLWIKYLLTTGRWSNLVQARDSTAIMKSQVKGNIDTGLTLHCKSFGLSYVMDTIFYWKTC